MPGYLFFLSIRHFSMTNTCCNLLQCMSIPYLLHDTGLIHSGALAVLQVAGQVFKQGFLAARFQLVCWRVTMRTSQYAKAGQALDRHFRKSRTTG